MIKIRLTKLEKAVINLTETQGKHRISREIYMGVS